jgi:hypothetical protein
MTTKKGLWQGLSVYGVHSRSRPLRIVYRGYIGSPKPGYWVNVLKEDEVGMVRASFSQPIKIDFVELEKNTLVVLFNCVSRNSPSGSSQSKEVNLGKEAKDFLTAIKVGLLGCQ